MRRLSELQVRPAHSGVARRAAAGMWCLGLLSTAAAFGQTRPAVQAKPVFEAASVKRSKATDDNWQGSPGTNDPESTRMTGSPMRRLLGRAFRLRPIDLEDLIKGPAWIDAEYYDVVAKIPPNTTDDVFRQMFQSLLIERFALAFHHETKEFSVYDLVVDKNGPKIKQAVSDPKALPAAGPTPRQRDGNGFPVIPPGMTGFFQTYGSLQASARGHAFWTVRAQPLSELALRLTDPNAGRLRVIDKTGLTGNYDYTLEFSIVPFPGVPVPDDFVSPMDAVREQLGLRLVPAKASLDVVVIDHLEKVPTEN